MIREHMKSDHKKMPIKAKKYRPRHSDNSSSSSLRPKDKKRRPEHNKSIGKKEKRMSFFKNIKIFSLRSGMDLPFLFMVLILTVIGLVMLFSASYPFAYYNKHGDSFYFIKNQLVFAVMGIIVMLMVSYIDYHSLHKIAVPILLLSFVMLIAVLFMPAISGVRRWIQIGSFSFQPSEVMKFSIVLSFAHFININFKRMGSFKYGILPYIMILAPAVVLLALEPHISCTAIVVLLAGGMLFIGGVKLKWFGMVLGAITSAILYLVLFTDKLTYANNRIAGWLDPFGADTTVDTWQTRQGLYAIGSGGLFGMGLGNSRQKYLYIPEPQNDFIFSVVCEELGFVGAVVILLIFAMLIWRGMAISIKAKDRFGCLLGIGLTSQLGLQVILNIAVVTNTIPNTGISLPFFSYGGTSLLMLLAQMGIILSISRTSKLETS